VTFCVALFGVLEALKSRPFFGKPQARLMPRFTPTYKPRSVNVSNSIHESKIEGLEPPVIH